MRRPNPDPGLELSSFSASLPAGMLIVLCLLSISVLGVAEASPGDGSWTELAGGSRGSYFWSIMARTGEGPTGGGPLGAQRPCLLATAGWRTGPLDYDRTTYRECAPPGGLPASGPPLVASGGQPSSGAPVQITAVGMIFAPAVHRVSITLADGRVETIHLRPLTPAAARASSRPLRYAAFAIRGTWCAERLISRSASGTTLWDSGVDAYVCGSEGEPNFVASS